ncbi:MAG TPA: aldo/keto reductase [Marinagarivorans sp.]
MTVVDKIQAKVFKRTLGNSNIPVSEIGLACDLIGREFGVEENIRAFSVLAAADTHGINFWDTADVYGNGLSESRLGAWQKQNEGTRLVATKAGRAKELFPDRHQYDRMRRSVEGSLERLQVDSIDVLHLHRLPEHILQSEQVWAWLDDFKRQGLIKHFGASVDTVSEALCCIDRPGLTSIETVINFFHRDPLDALVNKAAENHVAIIAREPFAHGLFNGMSVSSTPEQKKAFSYLERSRLQQRSMLQKINELVPATMTIEQMAIRWLLDHQEVTSVLTGAITVDQIKTYAKASRMPALPDELHQKLHEFYDTYILPFNHH